MPAVTVDNPLELPKVVAPLTSQRARSVKLITTAPQGLEGEGFPVRRAFAGLAQKDLDPFVHMDQMGEVDYGPGELGVGSLRNEHRLRIFLDPDHHLCH